MAAAASARREDFEGAAIPQPRISRFELKAGLAVLILFLGGGLWWWSNQNDNRLAELALTAATPGSSALRTVAQPAVNSAPPALPPMPEQRTDTQGIAATPSSEPVATAPVATQMAAPAAPVATSAGESSKAKPAKRKSKRQHGESKEAAAPVIERSEPAQVPIIERSEPPVEKRRSSMREQVAACHRLTLFEGERCLWKVCDGKWGKDGCPAYN
jgi:hypothetical protein